MPVLTLGALLGFITVALGAFGAHGLKPLLTDQGLEWWDTATFYMLTHAVVITGLGLTRDTSRNFSGPAFAFLLGALVFGGTLYGMALGAPRWLGAFTPIGGTSLLVGWIWLAFEGLRKGLNKN